MKGTESISSPFEFELDLYSPSFDLNLEKLLGTVLTVSLEAEDEQRKPVKLLHFSDIIGKIEQSETLPLNSQEGMTTYKAFIYPKLWLLQFSKVYRIFQKKKTLDIVTQVLKENGITDFDNLVSKCGQTIREYCVQYSARVVLILSLAC